ncbi:MAG: hypothetical protein ACREOR_07235 [Candidatus Binatia bacterium]
MLQVILYPTLEAITDTNETAAPESGAGVKTHWRYGIFTGSRN